MSGPNSSGGTGRAVYKGMGWGFVIGGLVALPTVALGNLVVFFIFVLPMLGTLTGGIAGLVVANAEARATRTHGAVTKDRKPKYRRGDPGPPAWRGTLIGLGLGFLLALPTLGWAYGAGTVVMMLLPPAGAFAGSIVGIAVGFALRRDWLWFGGFVGTIATIVLLFVLGSIASP